MHSHHKHRSLIQFKASHAKTLVSFIITLPVLHLLSTWWHSRANESTMNRYDLDRFQTCHWTKACSWTGLCSSVNSSLSHLICWASGAEHSQRCTNNVSCHTFVYIRSQPVWFFKNTHCGIAMAVTQAQFRPGVSLHLRWSQVVNAFEILITQDVNTRNHQKPRELHSLVLANIIYYIHQSGYSFPILSVWLSAGSPQNHFIQCYWKLVEGGVRGVEPERILNVREDLWPESCTLC